MGNGGCYFSVGGGGKVNLSGPLACLKYGNSQNWTCIRTRWRRNSKQPNDILRRLEPIAGSHFVFLFFTNGISVG